MKNRNLKNNYLDRAQRGFVLIIMLLILILGSTYFLLVELNSNALPMKANTEVSRQIEQVIDSLVGFALTNKRLPYAAGVNGVENNLLSGEGYLPWATLGIDGKDRWGRLLRYRVDNNYTVVSVIAPPSSGGFTVKNLAGATLSQTGGNSPPAVVFSCGVDGKPSNGNDANGVVNTNANCNNPGAALAVYVQDTYATGGFDDILLWLPRSTLVNRMVAAGKW